jgi:virginiamycin B lyase
MSIHNTRRRSRTALAIDRLESRELLAVNLGVIAEYPIPTSGGAPMDVALGPDGALWITESAADKIARYNSNLGEFSEYNVPTANSAPFSIAPGSATDPSLYFTENRGGKLGRITTDGKIVEAPVTDAGGKPIPDSPLVDLAYDPLGSDTFYTTQSNTPQVGIFQAGDFFQYEPFQSGESRPTASSANSTNWGVAFDNGLTSASVYFTERDANKIAVYETGSNASFVTHEYPLPTVDAKPLFIVKGPDGGFWFTESGANKIGRIDSKTRVITEYALATPNSEPWGITASATTIYFTESAGNKIGRITFVDDKPRFDEFPLPSGGAPRGVTMGEHGQVWFVEEDGDRLGLYYGDASVTPPYVFSAAASLPASAVGYTPLGLTGAPDGNLYVYAAKGTAGGDRADGLGRIPTATPQNATFSPYAPGSLGFGLDGGWLATGPNGTLWSGSWLKGTTQFMANEIDPGGFPNFKIIQSYPRINRGATSLTLGPDAVTMFSPDAFDPKFVDVYDAAGVTFHPLFPGAYVFAGIDSNIALGAGGELWALGHLTSDQYIIVRFNSDFSSKSYFPLTATFKPSFPFQNYVAFGSDGNLWFTDANNRVVGRITEDGEISYVPIPSGGGGMSPVSLVSAPDGNLYFLEASLNNLVQINPITERVVTTPLPVSIKNLLQVTKFRFSPVNALVVGPDGNLWFSDPDPANPTVIRYSLPPKGGPAPGPPATIASYMSATYRQLTGSPLASDRLQAITRQALGPRSKVALGTTLESLPPAERKVLLLRLSKTILGTAEYRRAQIDSLVARSLHRPADVKQLKARGTIATLGINLLGSRSYKTARAGGRNDALVAAYYHDLLRRSPTPAEANRWTRVLDHGLSARRVAATLASSPEGLSASVQSQFRRLLGRSATLAEMTAQVKNLRRTKSTNGLVLSLVTSPGFVALD